LENSSQNEAAYKLSDRDGVCCYRHVLRTDNGGMLRRALALKSMDNEEEDDQDKRRKYRWKRKSG